MRTSSTCPERCPNCNNIVIIMRFLPVNIYTVYFQMEVDNTNTSRASDTYLDVALDTKVYPQDYVSQLFNNIEWSSRVKHPRSKGRWVESNIWATQIYTMRYLEYKVEEGQIDLTNPFHIKESNLVRSKWIKKTKTKDLGVIEELYLESERVLDWWYR